MPQGATGNRQRGNIGTGAARQRVLPPQGRVSSCRARITPCCNHGRGSWLVMMAVINCRRECGFGLCGDVRDAHTEGMTPGQSLF